MLRPEGIQHGPKYLQRSPTPRRWPVVSSSLSVELRYLQPILAGGASLSQGFGPRPSSAEREASNRGGTTRPPAELGTWLPPAVASGANAARTKLTALTPDRPGPTRATSTPDSCASTICDSTAARPRRAVGVDDLPVGHHGRQHAVRGRLKNTAPHRGGQGFESPQLHPVSRGTSCTGRLLGHRNGAAFRRCVYMMYMVS